MSISAVDRKKLYTCHQRLINIVLELAETMELEVIQGHRTEAEHAANLKSGASRAKTSKHCKTPAEAVDLAPAGARAAWAKKSDLPGEAYVKVANAFLLIARAQGAKIRWGGDWDSAGDGNPKGTLNDLVHYETVEN